MKPSLELDMEDMAMISVLVSLFLLNPKVYSTRWLLLSSKLYHDKHLDTNVNKFSMVIDRFVCKQDNHQNDTNVLRVFHDDNPKVF